MLIWTHTPFVNIPLYRAGQKIRSSLAHSAHDQLSSARLGLIEFYNELSWRFCSFTLTSSLELLASQTSCKLGVKFDFYRGRKLSNEQKWFGYKRFQPDYKTTHGGQPNRRWHSLPAYVLID
jgi:hypothetical protein